jgi:hypothetical protein
MRFNPALLEEKKLTPEQLAVEEKRRRGLPLNTIDIDRWKLVGFWSAMRESVNSAELQLQLQEDVDIRYKQLLTMIDRLDRDLKELQPTEQELQQDDAAEAVDIGRQVGEAFMRRVTKHGSLITKADMKLFKKMPWLFEAVGGLPSMSVLEASQILGVSNHFVRFAYSPERLEEVTEMSGWGDRAVVSYSFLYL